VVEDFEVPDEQLEQLYQENLGQYDQVRSRHILVEDEAVARKALADVHADRSRFERSCASCRSTPRRTRAATSGLAGRGQFVSEFEEAVFGRQAG
jgi:parvulin-like peptidyl-prolyl isomerase